MISVNQCLTNQLIALLDNDPSIRVSQSFYIAIIASMLAIIEV